MKIHIPPGTRVYAYTQDAAPPFGPKVPAKAFNTVRKWVTDLVSFEPGDFYSWYIVELPSCKEFARFIVVTEDCEILE